ncbi:MAG: 2-oxo acid dehydrogenase subunit E2, partial [Planctomycetota bacterium]
MITEITLPEIGEGIESGDVINVLVSVGDAIEADQPVVEVETDKAVVDIPSPAKGKITEVLVKAGDTIRTGEAIAKIETEGETAPAPEKKPEKKEPPKKKEAPPVKRDAAPASPSIRRLARELGVDIGAVTGSGPRDRITQADVKAYVKKVMTSGPAAAPAAEPALPDFSRWGEIERKPLSRVRKLTARSMTQAWTTVPHVTQFDEADITELEEFRKKHAGAAEAAGGKLSVTAILLKILSQALKRFPQFNASLDTARGEIVFKKHFHIGIAVDTERGLLVPVLRDVDKKSLLFLAVELTEIAEKARTGKIHPDFLQGGTFTISNQGGIGGTNFTPIVYWPQAAILGVSRAAYRP